MVTTEMMDRIRHIEIRTRHLVNDSFAGEYHSTFRGRGIEFDEVRPWPPSSPLPPPTPKREAAQPLTSTALARRECSLTPWNGRGCERPGLHTKTQ